MPEQYTTKQLEAMTNGELYVAMVEWAREFRTAPTKFRIARARRMVERIKRENDRRRLTPIVERRG